MRRLRQLALVLDQNLGVQCGGGGACSTYVCNAFIRRHHVLGTASIDEACFDRVRGSLDGRESVLRNAQCSTKRNSSSLQCIMTEWWSGNLRRTQQITH